MDIRGICTGDHSSRKIKEGLNKRDESHSWGEASVLPGPLALNQIHSKSVSPSIAISYQNVQTGVEIDREDQRIQMGKDHVWEADPPDSRTLRKMAVLWAPGQREDWGADRRRRRATRRWQTTRAPRRRWTSVFHRSWSLWRQRILSLPHTVNVKDRFPKHKSKIYPSFRRKLTGYCYDLG